MSINRYNTIQAVALEKIVRRREQTYDNYEYYTQLLRGFVRTLNMRTPYGMRVFRGWSDHYKNGQITLPEDYVKYIAVGVNHDGVFKTLTYDSNIITDQIESCDSLEKLDCKCEKGILFPEYYYGGSFYPAMMSVGGGFNEAYFTEDRINKRIFIKPKLYNNEIIIYYVSSGDDINDYTVIPAPYVESAMIWIDKIEVENDIDAPESKKSDVKRRFDIAMREAAPVDSDMSYARFVDIVNRSNVKLKTLNPDAG